MATAVLDAYVVSSGRPVYAGRFAPGGAYVDDPTYFADDYVVDDDSPGPETYLLDASGSYLIDGAGNLLIQSGTASVTTYVDATTYFADDYVV